MKCKESIKTKGNGRNSSKVNKKSSEYNCSAVISDQNIKLEDEEIMKEIYKDKN